MTDKVRRSLFNALVVLFLIAGMAQTNLAAAQVHAAQATPAPLKPMVGYAVKHDTSAPLSEIAKHAGAHPAVTSPGRPALKLPKATLPAVENAFLLPASPVTASMPATLAGFEGVNNVDGVLPPDTNGDIGYDPDTGKKWYMQWVNLSYNIWDVTVPAAPVKAFATPLTGNSIWDGFGGVCETTNDGDPIVIFDQFANRWNVSQFSVGGPYYQCIAISQTADPTGAWHRYAFLVSNNKMNDYPKLGVWPDAYYMSVNQFTSSGSWAGSGVFAFERDKMLAGDPARFISFDLYSINPNFGGMLPSDADGDLPPPLGSPNIFAEWDDSTWIGSADALRLWEFHVDWGTTSNSTFGLNGQPNLVLNTLNVNIFDSLTYEGVPQPGTSVDLDALADRLMHRLQYRNLGAYQALVTNHTVNVGSDRAGIHWWELRKTTPTGSWSIQNESVHALADSKHRWMGSAALDSGGNLALGYSVSDAVSTYPSIYYAGRLATDPANTLSQAEVLMKAGTGYQTSSYERWGDYSMMAVDPRDGCTFWYTNEFLTVSGNATWRTWVGAFRYQNCQNATLGTLTGTIKSSETNNPIVGAKVSINGLDAFTNDSGIYSVDVMEGTYSVTASAFGFQSQTVNNVVITSGETTTRDFSLTPATLVTVQGKVSDASGHTGMPLYARVDISGYPGSPVYTNPFTGNYSVQLYQGSSYPFTVSVVMGGYGAPVERLITPPLGGSTENFALAVDLAACTALGYKVTGGIIQNFDTTSTPPGWTVVDNLGNGQVWRFDDPMTRTNLTGGSGNFAIVDSDYYLSGGAQDTSLVSPPVNFSGIGSVSLSFKTDYKHGGTDVADVDVSNDGGATWSNVWHKVMSYSGSVSLDISARAANQANVRVRFHYYNASWDYWWEVDNVVIGTPLCSTLPGGLVGGYVKDANTTTALNGASVNSSLGSAVSAATPADAALGDGFYLVFASTGTQNLTASMAGGYQPVTAGVAVTTNGAVQHDFNLPAGLLAFSPASVNKTMDASLTVTETVNLNNTGGIAASFSLSVASGLPAIPVVTGPFADATRRVSPKQLDALTALSVRDYTPPEAADWVGGGVLRTWQPRLYTPWGIGLTRDGQVWVSSAAAGGGDDLDHQYDTSGLAAGVTADTTEWATSFAADMAFDLVGGHLWQVDVGGEGCIFEMDPATATFTGVKVCPEFPHGVRGLAFDALNRTFYGGSWVDGIIYHFDLQGRLLDSVRTGINLSGMAVNPMTGHLFVLSNAATGKDVYVLDARNGYTVLGGFDIEGMVDFGQAGLEFSADGHLWAVDQLGSRVFEVSSGESDIFAFADVSWLNLEPVSGTVAAGGTQAIGVTFNTAGMLAGVYQAHVQVGESTPYITAPLVITLTINTTHSAAINAPVTTQLGLPGETLTFSMTVTNTGNVSDSFTISVGAHTWVVTAPDSVGPLAAFETSAPFDVTITIPAMATVGSEVVEIIATSTADPAKSGSVFLIARTGLPIYLPIVLK